MKKKNVLFTLFFTNPTYFLDMTEVFFRRSKSQFSHVRKQTNKTNKQKIFLLQSLRTDPGLHGAAAS